MTSYRTDKRQIAKNTGLLYLRSLFNLFLSLYTSRLILQTLGVDDYGIYNAIGGFVSMFWMVTGSLNGAITRFLTFEIGRQEEGRPEQVFSMALTLLLALGLLIVLVAEPLGTWYLRHRMTIPPGREVAAFWVFQSVILSSVFSLITAPFNSAIIAHEKFGLYAYLNIGETTLLFCLALFLAKARIAWDVLIVYAVARVLITLLSQILAISYSIHHFEESKFRLRWNVPLFKQLFGYTSWSLLGSFSNMFNNQGLSVAINVFFGPAVNAARGLSNTVANSVGIFVSNFTSALAPQITKSYAAGDWDYMRSLVFKGSKIAYFIMLMVVLPLSVEMEFVLSLWLVEVPEYTVVFTRIALLGSLIAMFDIILGQAQVASGTIKYYQIALSATAIFCFIVSYCLLRFGHLLVAAYCVSLVKGLVCVGISTYIVSRTVRITVGSIFKFIYLPEAVVTFVSSIFPILIYCILPEGWIRFFLVLIVSIMAVALSSFFIGLTAHERLSVRQTVEHYYLTHFKR